jgi:hypothetical protein
MQLTGPAKSYAAVSIVEGVRKNSTNPVFQPGP